MNPRENAPSVHETDLQFTNAPNLLTLSRIFFVPVVIFLLFWRTIAGDLLAAAVFGIASFTDFLDGYLARTRNLVTVYGKLMDPLADKFLVACSLIMLQHLGRIHPAVVMLLICREMGITGLRALASAEGVVIAASASAKWKTAFQMIAIALVIVGDSIQWLPLARVGEWLLYVSLAMSLWSAKDYIVDFFKGLRETRRKRASEKQERIALRRARKEARRAAKTKAREQRRAKLQRESAR